MKPNTINGDLAFKLLDVIDSIDSEKDFNKLKLTPLEYETARLLLKEYWDKGEARTFYYAVADFFRRNGFSVKKADDGIDYIIGDSENG